MSEEVYVIFCRNMQELRRVHGYSKKKMAEVCGVSVATINKIEADILPPRLLVSVVFRASDHFGVPMRCFFLPDLGR